MYVSICQKNFPCKDVNNHVLFKQLFTFSIQLLHATQNILCFYLSFVVGIYSELCVRNAHITHIALCFLIVTDETFDIEQWTVRYLLIKLDAIAGVHVQ